MWGAQRLLSVRRRLRFPRPAAGRAGALVLADPTRARAPAARGLAPVRRRGRAALVARAGRPRRSHAHLRRSTVAGLRNAPVRESHRRRLDPRRAGAVSRGPRCSTPTNTKCYERPSARARARPLYEHCVRAVSLNLQNGAHGLPLMGSGDWNDGMNLVGAGGRGESVWLGWFFAARAGSVRRSRRRRGEHDRAQRVPATCLGLAGALDAAWDGNWYRRAYFDDGTPLGSAANAECRIDSIAQSWAVISGRARCRSRARRRWNPRTPTSFAANDALILLLTPPFDKTDAESRLHPGVRAWRA